MCVTVLINLVPPEGDDDKTEITLVSQLPVDDDDDGGDNGYDVIRIEIAEKLSKLLLLHVNISSDVQV